MLPPSHTRSGKCLSEPWRPGLEENQGGAPGSPGLDDKWQEKKAKEKGWIPYFMQMHEKAGETLTQKSVQGPPLSPLTLQSSPLAW